jgi:spore germination protein YaaH
VNPKRWLSSLALVVLAGLTAQQGIPDAALADNPPRKILSGWLPYYSMKSALPAAINNSDLITQVSPFWYTLKDQNTIQDLYTPANPSTPMIGPLATLRGAGFKVIPTITDGTAVDPKTGNTSSMVLSNLLANPSSRANVVASIMKLVTTNNFDGIDLDFEDFAYIDPISTWPTTQARWVQFISDLSTALHAQGKLLSITTPPLFNPSSGKKGYYQYAWSQIAAMIDQLHIMAYDYSTSSPGPIGPIGWTTDAVTYAISVMAASKVYIGVPGYGRDWVTAVSGTCPSQPVNYLKTVATGVVSTFVMHDVSNLASAYGATPTFSAKYGESTFTYQKIYNGTTADGSLTTCTATRTVWYQDQQSFTLRANLVGQYRLGGISEWTIGMEDPTAVSAVRTVATAIAPDQVLANLALLNPTMTSTPSSTPTSSAGTSAGTPLTTGSSLSVGTPLLMTGTFSLPDKTPVVGVPVHLQFQGTGGIWNTVADSVSGSDGKYSLPILLGSTTTLRVISEGSWVRNEGDSNPIAVALTRVISWAPPSSMRHGVSYLVSGQVQPKVAGLVVSLENPSNPRGVAAQPLTTTTDTNGNFSFTISNKAPGFYTYDLSTPADSNFAATTTPFVTVVVR